MIDEHVFVSYSRIDGREFALRLVDELAAGPPSYAAWVDVRELQPGQEDWDRQLVEAIKTCSALLFVMTEDSVRDGSGCKPEWVAGLRYKKPIIPLRLVSDAELPFRLSSREVVDFSDRFDAGMARLRRHLSWRETPVGVLAELRFCLADAEYELPRAQAGQRQRIEHETRKLRRQIGEQQRVIEDPRAAVGRTEAPIGAGTEREPEPNRSRFAHASDSPPTARAIAPRLPLELEPAELMGKDPDERDRSVGDLRGAALASPKDGAHAPPTRSVRVGPAAAADAAATDEAPNVSPTSRGRPATRRTKWMLVGAATLAVAVLAIVLTRGPATSVNSTAAVGRAWVAAYNTGDFVQAASYFKLGAKVNGKTADHAQIVQFLETYKCALKLRSLSDRPCPGEAPTAVASPVTRPQCRLNPWRLTCHNTNKSCQFAQASLPQESAAQRQKQPSITGGLSLSRAAAGSNGSNRSAKPVACNTARHWPT